MRKASIALLLAALLNIGAPVTAWAAPEKPVVAQETEQEDDGDFPWGLLGLLGLAGLLGRKRDDNTTHRNTTDTTTRR